MIILLMPWIGGISGLTAAFIWSLTAILFTSVSRRMGSFAMSHFRMVFAVLYLFVFHFLIMHSFWPKNLDNSQLLWLSLSGFAGFFLTDTFLFQCYMDLGPRLGVLVFNLYPFVSATLAWIFLKEVLSIWGIIGMVVAMCGMLIVVLEKHDQESSFWSAGPRRHFRRGIIFAVCAACFQGISYALAKPALIPPHQVDPLTVTLVRAVPGMLGYWGVSLVRGKLGEVVQKIRHDSSSFYRLLFTSLLGPVFGVWLAMVAIKYTSVAIATTMMAMVPITILPMVVIAYKEKVSWRAILGAVVACVGVAMLFNVK